MFGWKVNTFTVKTPTMQPKPDNTTRVATFKYENKLCVAEMGGKRPKNP
jgi:hypothetical protein